MSLFLFFCTFIIIPFTCSLRDKSLSASELLVWRSFVGTEKNANVKYLISSDEREAENNPLWREVAEAGSEIQSLIHPPAQPTLGRWSLGPAALASHRTPHSTAGTWGTSGQDPLCSQAGIPGNEALGHKLNAQLHSSRDLRGLCCPLFPNYFCPSGLEGAKKSHNAFLIQWWFLLLRRYTGERLFSLDNMAHRADVPDNVYLMHTLNCNYKERGVAACFWQLLSNQKQY